MTAVDLIRLYDFVAGNIIRSAEMDAELSQLVAANNKVVDDLTALLAAGGAALVGFTPTADIASTTVQTAIEEVLVTAKDAQSGSILPGTLTTIELVTALAQAAVASRVHDVGGTATAITATDADIAALYDNMPFNFIIGAGNSGAATTLAIGALGARPVYKVGTTTAPNLTAGKQASFWYDAGAGCFFLKASAEGTATVAQVLAGVPFSTEVDSGLVGTMPDRAGDTAATDVQYSGTTIRLRASEGSRDGVNDYITHADGARVTGNIRDTATIDGVTGTYDHEATNPITAGDVVSPHVGFVNGAKITGSVVEKVGSATVITPSTADQAIPAGRYGGAAGDGKVLAVANASPGNIKQGVVIAGVTGTSNDIAFSVGDNPQYINNITYAIAQITYYKTDDVEIANSGVYRVKFTLMNNGGTAYGQIYKNGVAIGIERSLSTINTPTVYAQDFALSAGDNIQLYVRISNASYNCYRNSFSICTGELSLFTIVD